MFDRSRVFLLLTAASMGVTPIAFAQTSTVENAPKTPDSPWKASGEFGFAAARGNSDTETMNGRFFVQHTSDQWIHTGELSGMRTRGETEVKLADGTTYKTKDTTANRLTLNLGSAYRISEFSQWLGNYRFDKDDFASYDRQQVISIGYGTRLINRENLQLDMEVGPGYRRAHNADENRNESGLIARAKFNLNYALTENSALTDVLLIESGSGNTYVQNDLALAVSMNAKLALKAGLQTRYNSDVTPGKKKTDTLTTMNLVYNFK